MHLDRNQILFFKENGYLVLKGFVDEATREDWQNQIWERLGSCMETPGTWPSDQRALNGFTFDPSTEPAHYPPLLEIVEQLGGGQFGRGPDDHGGGGAPIIKWPHPEQERDWQIPESGHIDGYPPPDGWAPFMLGATTYLYDVESHGGAFVYWPGSHKTTHTYFLEHPEQVDGCFREQGKGGVFAESAPHGPQEFVAASGDLLLWHSYMCHNGSKNVRHRPRFAVVTRFSHLRTEETAFRYEIPVDLWKYWAI